VRTYYKCELQEQFDHGEALNNKAEERGKVGGKLERSYVRIAALWLQVLETNLAVLNPSGGFS